MNKPFANRVYIFYGLLLVVLLIFWGRLFELQLIYGRYFRQLAEGNRIKKIIEPAPRGLIFDRHQKPLVRNVPVYQRCDFPTSLCEAVSREEALKLEANGGKAAADLRIAIGREYVYGPVLAHVLGYLGEASKKEVETNQRNLGDLVGRMGFEQEYDEKLRGFDGGQIFEVNTLGEKVREIGQLEPVPGQDFYLSLDAELSKVAFLALEGQKGAVVVTEAKTGQVVVLVSSPAFNPEKITREVLADEHQPLFNRAIAGVYPPGSTFKIVTAAAGIQEGKINSQTTYTDTGQIRIGEYVYQNWYFSQYGKTEGEIGLVRAIKRSTDTFFYKVGEWVGARRLADWAKAFGLGRLGGIDLPAEAAGLVPDPEWKEKTKKERWFLGNTYHFAIGQADLLTTPLQINMMTSVIANDGVLCAPRVKEPESERARECQNLHLKPETLRLIREGMKEACSPGGTAFPFFDFAPQVACKTGTAEFGDPQDRTHAWLTAFAPVSDPEIVVTVLVEAGGEGSYVAAPIAKKVIAAWFEK